MSKKVNPTLVGTFVLGAVALAVASVIVFGGGSLLDKKHKIVLCFSESIDGLDIGSPVSFMGVRIGSVASIELIVDGDDGDVFMRPVTISVEANRVTYIGNKADRTSPEEGLEMLIQNKGLRAQLASQSMLTGKLKIQLAFHPETPVKRRNIPSPYMEMPTIPSTAATIKNTIEQLPIDAVMNDMRQTLNGINQLVNDAAAKAILTNLNTTLIQLDQTLTTASSFMCGASNAIETLSQSIAPIMLQSEHSIDTLNNALTNATEFMVSMNTKAGPFLDSVTIMADKLNGMMDVQSPMRHAVLNSLQELQRTLRSFGDLTSYLERHPESIIQGKK
ncbi:MAG: MCE family protein [Spartobacteria bacterium]|nr:MCE family protein [Spartobacteria bacterium]